MKLKSILSTTLVASLLLSCGRTGKNDQTDFNGNWAFHIVEDTLNYHIDYSATDFETDSWENVRLPHTANIEPLVVNDQWQGICWYHKTFDISNFSKEKKYFIEFEGAMNVIDIWINDKHLKKDMGGYLPVAADITDYVKEKDNTIRVRLDNRDNPTTGPKPLKILDFNMYGGLYREVNFIEKNNIYISNPSIADIEAGGGVFITFPTVNEKMSEVKIQTHVINEGENDKGARIKHVIKKGNDIVEEVTADIILRKGKQGNTWCYTWKWTALRCGHLTALRSTHWRLPSMTRTEW